MMRHDGHPWSHWHDHEHHAAGGGRGRGRGGGRRGGGGGSPPGGPSFVRFSWGEAGGDGGGRGGPFDRLRAMFGPNARRGRGDVRAAILLLLAEQPNNGYQIIQEIERRSEGTWRPSSGSIYPTLQQLEDEGLVTTETTPNGRVYKLADRGKKYVEAHRDELGTPWQAETSGDPRADVMRMMGELGPALGQVCRFGTPEQVAQARKIISDARRALYGLLAEDDDGDDD